MGSFIMEDAAFIKHNMIWKQQEAKHHIKIREKLFEQIYCIGLSDTIEQPVQ